jgi:5'-nucleotidase
MILLLDMDGPLADFDLAVWQYCQANDIEMNIQSMESPGRKRFLSDNIVSPRDRKLVRNLIERAGLHWFLDLPLVEGAQDGVAELEDEGIDIWVCTKPLEANDSCRDDKGLWIKRYFPSLINKLIIAPNKGMVKGDILLDDAPKHSWFRYAEWSPVIFPAGFNGLDSEWGKIPAWTWGDPIEDLLTYR